MLKYGIKPSGPTAVVHHASFCVFNVGYLHERSYVPFEARVRYSLAHLLDRFSDQACLRRTLFGIRDHAF